MKCSRRAALCQLGSAVATAGGPRWVGAESLVVGRDISGFSPTIATQSGKVRGRRSKGVDAYRGIPYGAPTTGAARFLPPRPPASWTGVRDVLDCGPPCVQINTDLAAWVDPRAASEDCLYLNVWRPSRSPAGKLAVMVWIHGGAYLSGSGGLSIYDGAALARHGNVVVITVNHRLSALGYLYLGAFGDAFPDSGNAGQLDLVAALRWVRDNIENFGGDPANVTVFGESGGGGKITALCQMPAARGLFHKAIIESGSLWNTLSREQAAEIAAATLFQLGIDPKNIGRLLQEPATNLISAANAVWISRNDALSFAPVVDRRSILDNSWATSAPSEAFEIAMLIGTNQDEAAYFVKDPVSEPADDKELVSRIPGASFMTSLSEEEARTLVAHYRTLCPAASRLQILISIATDLFLWRNAITQAEHKISQNGAPVYMYEFSWRTPCFTRSWAPHGAEIPFVFGNLDYAYAWDDHDTPAVRAKADPDNLRFGLCRSMMGAWAAFARTGNPSVPSLPEWPPYDLQRRSTMNFAASCQTVSDPRAAQRALMKQLF